MICSICGKEEDPKMFITEDILKERQLCHSCNFWREVHQEDMTLDPHEWCVVNRTHYRILPSIENKRLSGFSGHLFHIIFDDGYECNCDNLWCQGNIPEHYKFIFPNNARFK